MVLLQPLFLPLDNLARPRLIQCPPLIFYPLFWRAQLQLVKQAEAWDLQRGSSAQHFQRLKGPRRSVLGPPSSIPLGTAAPAAPSNPPTPWRLLR